MEDKRKEALMKKIEENFLFIEKTIRKFLLLEIDNSKEAAVQGKWKNPGASFYNQLLNAGWVPEGDSPNMDECISTHQYLEEAYLIAPINKIRYGPYGQTPFSRSGCKYPHHTIKGDKLVVHIDGLKAAYSRAKQMGECKGKVKDHLEKHYKELGLYEGSKMQLGESVDQNFSFIEQHIREETGIDPSSITALNVNEASHVSKPLVNYIENNIIPLYDHFDGGHDRRHAHGVIKLSIIIANSPELKKYKINPDIVYTAAAFHDVGLIDGRENHHVKSIEILRNDSFIKSFFQPEEIDQIAQAIYKHRSRFVGQRESVYEKILADADNEAAYDFKRSCQRLWAYRCDHMPEMNDREKIEDMVSFAKTLLAPGGKYSRLEIPVEFTIGRLNEVRVHMTDPVEIERVLRQIQLIDHKVPLIFDKKHYNEDSSMNESTNTVDGEIHVPAKEDYLNPEFVKWLLFKTEEFEDDEPETFDFSIFKTNPMIKNYVYGYFIDNIMRGIIRIKYQRRMKTYNVDMLFVDPSFHRKHIGSTLLQYAINEFGKYDMMLYVFSDNAPAINLYKKFGFVIYRTIDGYPEKNKNRKQHIMIRKSDVGLEESYESFEDDDDIYDEELDTPEDEPIPDLDPELMEYIDRNIMLQYPPKLRKKIQYRIARAINIALSEELKLYDIPINVIYAAAAIDRLEMFQNDSFFDSFFLDWEKDVIVSIFTNSTIDLYNKIITDAKNEYFYDPIYICNKIYQENKNLHSMSDREKLKAMKDIIEERYSSDSDYIRMEVPCRESINRLTYIRDILHFNLDSILIYLNILSENDFVSEFIESSNGKLDFSFRYGINVENGHKIKIVFDLKPESVESMGSFDGKRDWRESNIENIKNIRKIGNNNFLSKATVKTIIDEDTGKKMHTVHMIGSLNEYLSLWEIFKDEDNIREELSSFKKVNYLLINNNLSVRERVIKSKFWNPPESIVRVYNVGEREKVSTFKMTRPGKPKYYISNMNIEDIRSGFNARGVRKDTIEKFQISIKHKLNEAKDLTEYFHRRKEEITKDTMDLVDQTHKLIKKDAEKCLSRASEENFHGAVKFENKVIRSINRLKRMKRNPIPSPIHEKSFEELLLEDVELDEEENPQVPTNPPPMEEEPSEEVQQSAQEQEAQQPEEPQPPVEEPEEEPSVKSVQQMSWPQRVDVREAAKNGANRKKLYIAFIEWAKSINIRNIFSSVFDDNIFDNNYPFVPHEMRYFYRIANPMLCVLQGDLTFFQLSELMKINGNNKQIVDLMVFAATPNDLRVFNVRDKKVYQAVEENGNIKIRAKLGETFDLYIQNMIQRGDILNSPHGEDEGGDNNDYQ